MAQDSWKIEKDESNCEILKPTSSSPSSSSSSSLTPSPILFLKTVSEPSSQNPGRFETLASPDSALSEEPAKESPERFTNRCFSCRKKVGLTGFRCRCGDLFCGSHRYSDTHDCSFDYEASGREAIAKANPLIRASKIIRI